jgi:hypothetical protein
MVGQIPGDFSKAVINDFQHGIIDGVCNAFKKCFDFINCKGGFTLVGWYKKGLVSGVSTKSQVTLNKNNNNNIKTSPNTLDCCFYCLINFIIDVCGCFNFCCKIRRFREEL